MAQNSNTPIKKDLNQAGTSWLFKAHSHIEDEAFQEAHWYIDSLPKEQAYSYFIKGQIYKGLRQYQKAISCFLSYNQKQEQKDFYNLAICYAQLEKYDSTSYYLKKSLSSEHHRFSLDYETEPLLEAFRNTTYWEDIWKKNYYSTEEKSLEQAIYYRNKKELNLALDILDELIYNNRQFDKAYYYRALYLIELNEDYSSAIKDLKKALKIKPNCYDYNALLSDIYFKKNKYSKALKYGKTTFDLSPYNRKDVFRLAQIYYRVSNYKEAEKLALLSLKLKPIMKYYRLLGLIYFDHQQYQKALEIFNQASSRYPRALEIIIPKVKTYFELEQYEDANYLLGLACDIEPNNGELWFLKGLAKLYKNEKDLACKYFKQANYLNYPQASHYLLQECQ